MRPFRLLCAPAFLCSLLSVVPAAVARDAGRVLAGPIDAVSVAFPAGKTETAARYEKDGTWSDWQPLTLENEQDPGLRESTLLILPRGVARVEIRDADVTPHPITVDDAPAGALFASLVAAVSGPRILSRNDWGADESLQYASGSSPASQPAADEAPEDKESGTSASSAASGRIADCQQAQKDHPSEFRTTRTVSKDADGRAYRWTRTYSADVKLLVVHHTAAAVGGDDRPGEERVRAIYRYHAVSRGWGDVGYHYLVDEDGKIYEGKAGGQSVVGGHAYCNNVGTVGIALLGSFSVERPTQAQTKSLQWLLDRLAREYGIDMHGDVRYHGKSLSPVVGHRDLLSTDCPGQTLYAGLEQIRRNVADGALTRSVAFPKPAQASSSRARSAASSRRSVAPGQTGVTALGETALSGPPGGQMLLSVRYRAGDAGGRKGSVAGGVERSDPAVALWQERGAAFVRVTDTLDLPAPVPPNGTVALRLKVQLPSEEGNYRLEIGNAVFTLSARGKRVPIPRGTTVPAAGLPRPPRVRTVPQASSAASRRAASSSSYSARPVRRGSAAFRIGADPAVRIRLNAVRDAVTVQLPPGGRVNDGSAAGSKVFLFREGDACVAAIGNTRVATGIVRLEGGDGLLRVLLDAGRTPAYRGVLECRIVEGSFALINELPLESYLLGLSEEPDTEPYEKQRAFAIAARSYLAHYLSPSHRKFPGKPYDGSDSPAEFQAYAGAGFEKANPRWLEAVRDTRGEVLAYRGEILIVPYFSASDGRTLSPAEAGWNSFPHPEVFASKPDPWCEGLARRGHGVGMSGCGAEAQAEEGRTAEEILGYYYAGVEIGTLR